MTRSAYVPLPSDIDVRYCTCGTARSRQDGYTRLNDLNDWGCGRCRKPTQLFLQNVILPREHLHAAIPVSSNTHGESHE